MYDNEVLDKSKFPIKVTEDKTVADALAQMREGRTAYPSVFLDFVQYKKYHTTRVFCFYEGEDGCYYDCRIKEHLQSDKFITFITKNKTNLLKTMRMIQATPRYQSIKKMFFIDHDFDDVQPYDEDLFETDCYSIENYYVGEDTLCRILRTAFHINEGNPALETCLKLYQATFTQFHEKMLPYNARVKYNHQYVPESKRSNLLEINDHKLTSVTLGSVNKVATYDDTLNKIDSYLKPDLRILAELEIELRNVTNPCMIFRGKNELYCMQHFLECLRKEFNNTLHTDDSKVFQNRNIKIKVNLDPMNNPLGTLSQYAATPQKLIDFIIAHRLN